VAKILIAWQIGGGYGRIAQIAPVLSALKALGHQCALTVPSYWIAQQGVRDLLAGMDALRDVEILISPDGWTGDADQALGFASFPELLRAWSFDSRESLLKQVRLWHACFAEYQPDAVLSHHAPGAVIAAQLQGLPVGQFGDGFVVPRLADPMPSFAPWRSSPNDHGEVQARALAIEAQVLKSVQGVFEQFAGGKSFAQTPPISLAAWLSVVPDYLCTLPILDHYGERPGAFYYGAHNNPVKGVTAKWPDVLTPASPKVLVYLSSNHPATAALLQALSTLAWPTVIHQQGRHPMTAHVRHYAEPINMSQALVEADLFVCHAPHLSCAQAVASGKPVLLLPSNIEQEMVAMQMIRLGVGRVPSETSVEGLVQALKDLQSDHVLKQRSTSVAVTLQKFDAHSAAAELAEDFCLDMGLNA
jgi:hypothetical protein